MPELITIRTVKNQLSLLANKAAEEAYKSLFNQIIKRSETPQEYRARVLKNGEREDRFTPEVLHDKIREICQAKKKGGEGYVVFN